MPLLHTFWLSMLGICRQCTQDIARCFLHLAGCFLVPTRSLQSAVQLTVPTSSFNKKSLYIYIP